MSTLTGYEYTYTPIDPDQFRLVHLNLCGANSSAEDLPSIDFVLARFDQPCPYRYTALSYAWDKGSGVEDIQVTGTRPGTLEITKSLACALRSLRMSEHQVLWIDALCIDQNNLPEKNHQVNRMAEIYMRATQVVLWLGEAANDSDLAMKFIMDISVKEIDNLAADQGSAKAWVALDTLMQRSWFTRRWVVQEVAFARNPVLRCGSAVVSWVDFCAVVELYVEKLDTIRQCVNDSALEFQSSFSTAGELAVPFASGFTFGVLATAFILGAPVFIPLAALGPAIALASSRNSDYSSIGGLRGVGVHSLITVYSRVLPRMRDSNEPRRLCTMEELLSYLSGFEVTNKRDEIFALASLAKDYMDVTPDYKQSVVRVYKNAIERAVATSGSLNIVCRPWAQPLKNLPSWVLPRSVLPFRPNNQGNYVRKRADTLVCLPHQRIYHASGSICASTSFNDDETRFVLTCNGFQLPAVAWIGDRAKGSIPKSWHNSLRGANMEHSKEMFWRTLVVDRDWKGNIPPHWYSMACKEAYKLCPDGGLNTTKLLQDQRKGGEQISSKLKEFLGRVQAATWNRRLLRLEDDSLGLVHKTTKQTDRICILYGCDVPVVLRRLKGDTWEFIGEAFICGVMDGEALDRYEDMTFNLV